MQIVTLKNVSKSYNGVTVVDDLSLEITSGEIVALLGQTGAGKSTIMNMIMGQSRPTQWRNPGAKRRPAQQRCRAAGLGGCELSRLIG